MNPSFDQSDLTELPELLSSQRFATYLAATNGNVKDALILYQWNCEISAALMVPIHIAEIILRNATAAAIEAQYGDEWYLSEGYRRTLPNSKRYSPLQDFENVTRALRSRGALSSGAVISSVKFAFWEAMYTKRHDGHLWRQYFSHFFPNAPPFPTGRRGLNEGLRAIRRLRNRIAHHEPIFVRNLADDYGNIIELISWRSQRAADWALRINDVIRLLANDPSSHG